MGENSFKFFVQFNFYALVYCICLIVAMVYYTVEQIRRPVSISYSTPTPPPACPCQRLAAPELWCI